jgi:hypothetical protein
MAHPTCSVLFHTMAVKWPVAELNPGEAGLYLVSSAIHRLTALVHERPVPMARFSPYGPLECCRLQVADTVAA